MAEPWKEFQQEGPWSEFAGNAFFPGTSETKPASEGNQFAKELLFGKPPEKTLGERGAAVAQTGGLGAATSLALPRLLQLYPPTRPLGVALGTVGPKMRTFLGGVAGAGSETAGQTAEMMGAPPIYSEAARLAPLPIQAGVEQGFTAGTGMVGRGLRSIVKAGEPESLSQATREAVRKLEGAGGVDAPKKIMSVLEQRAAEVEQEIAQLLAAPVGREAEIAGIRQRAEAELASLKAEIAARKQRMIKIGAESTRQSDQALQTALRTKLGLQGLIPKAEKRTEQALSEAAGIRRLVGEPTDPTNIGAPLRQRIVTANEDELKLRSDNYKRDEAVRDQAVASKEGAGQFVTDLPEYQTLLQELRNKLLIGQTAQKQAAAPVTEAGVKAAYKRLYDALSMQRKQVGVNAEGNPVYKTYPPSFSAIDDVRRKIGDVAFGKEVEGYEGIEKDIAKDMYEKLSDIQRKFAGKSQDVLQGNYEAASTLLDRFKGQRGRKALALDKYNDAEFATDPSRLPATYFSSKGGVQDLIAMTGDKDLVTKAARDFAASQIVGMNSKQLNDWVRKSEWLRELPALESDLNRYRIALEKAEQIGARGEKTVTGLRKRMQKAATAGEQRQAAIETQMVGERKAARGDIAAAESQMKDVSKSAEKEVSDIEREAKQLRGERATEVSGLRQQADMIRGDPRPAERMEKLLLSSRAPEEVALVADAIKANPEAMKSLPQVVRTLIANKVSPANMAYEWRQSIRPLLEKTGVVDKAALSKIDGDVQAVIRTLDARQRVDWLQNTIGKLLAIGPVTTFSQFQGAE